MLVVSALDQPMVQPVASSEIPYRHPDASNVAGILTSYGVTALLLITLVGSLLYARRRGWIAGGVVRNHEDMSRKIRIVTSQRISTLSTTHVVRYENRNYMIVESTRGSMATLVPLALESQELDAAP